MIKRKFQNPSLYLAAFIIGTIIFICGFLITSKIIYDQDSRVLQTNIDNLYSIFESGIGINLLNENVCSINFSEKADRAFYFHRKLISDLENALGKDDKKVILQKKIYTIAQAQHLEIKMLQKEKCGLNVSIVLFFYSNEESVLEESEKMGSILDYVSSKNKNLIIYSFDTNIDSSIITGLLNKYNIKQVPSVVANDKVVIPLNTANDLIKKI